MGLKVVLFFAGVILLSSVVVFVIERRTNDGFVSFFDSIWWTIVTISTVGYGERVPASTWGRVAALVTIFLGMGVMGTVTGRIASFLMERQMKEENGLLDHAGLKGHFIVCGWKREMNHVLYEILAANQDINPLEILLLNKAGSDEINAVRSDPELKGIKFVNGDFTEERDLRRAGIRGAKRVLVLADDLNAGDLQQIDSTTVMAVMLIKNLNRRAYVCAELLEEKFEKYLRLSHCDEILLSRNFSRSMLASAATGTGLSHVVGALLGGEAGVVITTRPVPEQFVGKTYGELHEHLEKEKENLQLIGLLENTGNITARKQEALREAQKNPDISKIIPELKGVKTLTANDPVINPPWDYPVQKYAKAVVIAGSYVAQAQGAS
ncbi:MAG: transporter [Chitinivibrionales bacterium]|nr:transporter [Chitinivibrionales bacterium]MBD3395742.1 transporter [Chitinivibrionales bacterium]